MKKLLSLILAALIALSMVPMAMAEDVIELDMYFPVSVGGGPDQLISNLCDEFHAEYPGIKINPIYAGSYADTRTKVFAAIKACAEEEKVYVIGGSSVYKDALPLADELALTLVDDIPEKADTFFPEINKEEWTETFREEHPSDEQNEKPYCFINLMRK